MRLSGAQAERVAEISDGAEVILSKRKGTSPVIVYRPVDGLRVEVGPNGSEVVLTAAKDD